MKIRLLFTLILLTLTINSFSQNSGPGFAQINDFPNPNRSVFWLRTSIPAGSVALFTMCGTNYIKMSADTIFMNSLVTRNDTSVYKLVGIGQDSMLKAFIPKYLLPKDTINLYSSILNKLNISDTTGKWLNYRYLPSNFDTLNTNELQTLSITGRNITLSQSGNTVTIPIPIYDSIPGKPSALILTTTGTSGSATLTGTTINIPNYTYTAPLADYTNTTTTTGTTGNAVFYLTSDKTLSGTALFTNINSIQPIVNDASLNYSYGWTISGDKKTLTINVKVATGINIGILGLTLLGIPANVPVSTIVNVLVKGS